MAIDSKREKIILRIVEELQTVSWVEQVKRVRPTMVELESYPGTMLPLLTVEAGLPVPIEKKSSRKPGEIQAVISNLTVKVFCYILENENPDSIISNYLDDLWSKMYEDVLKGGLCIETIVKPQMDVLIMFPYTAFSINVTLTYLHTTNNI